MQGVYNAIFGGKFYYVVCLVGLLLALAPCDNGRGAGAKNTGSSWLLVHLDKREKNIFNEQYHEQCMIWRSRSREELSPRRPLRFSRLSYTM